MRDVKFRGYSHSEGWVFGCYATDGVGYHAILMGDEEDESCMLNEHVEKRSIGQYTGLKDKNGVEIYEGDVVYIAGYGDYTAEFPFLELYDAVMENDIGSILGNIYENPELLESDNE